MSNQSQNSDKPQSGSKGKAFLTGAIVAVSALAGGLAVVLWNRKALSRLRQSPEPDKAEAPTEEDS